MTFTPKKIWMPALALALFMAPAASFAQGYDGVMGAQPNYKGGVKGGGEESFDGGADVEGEAAESGVGGFGAGQGFDEMYAGGKDAGKDLYSYVGNEKSNPANKREKAATEARNKRDAMVAKMKANSEKMLKQQKERAWKAAHKGQEYPGEEETSEDSGYGDDGGGGGNDDALFGKDSGGDPFGSEGGMAGYGGDGDSGDSSDSGGGGDSGDSGDSE